MRSEKIDTRAVLNGEWGDANFVDPRVRRAEYERIVNYWPLEIIRMIRDGFLEPPPWRLLLDPTAWNDVPPDEVHAYVEAYLGRGRWPSLDNLRRRFSRVSNHRTAAENPRQESLLSG